MNGLEYILTIGASCLMIGSGCAATILLWSLFYHIKLDDKNNIRAMASCFAGGVFFALITVMILRI